MEIFDVFDLSTYTFLRINAGGPMGDTITESSPAEGVFKLRDGFSTATNQETRQSDATLHIRATESFISTVGGNLVGHGIRKDGQDYKIIGQTGGDNYDNGVREHYRLTLERKQYS